MGSGRIGGTSVFCQREKEVLTYQSKKKCHGGRLKGDGPGQNFICIEKNSQNFWVCWKVWKFQPPQVASGDKMLQNGVCQVRGGFVILMSPLSSPHDLLKCPFSSRTTNEAKYIVGSWARRRFFWFTLMRNKSRYIKKLQTGSKLFVLF